MQEIDASNRMAVVSLQVSGPQARFVAPNVLSLLQAAHTDHETWMRAIVADGVVVGLCLVEFLEEDELGLALTGQPFLWRFVVDEHYQGLGFGRGAVDRLVSQMRARGSHTLFVSCVPGIGSPLRFYEHVGFVDTGEVMEGERILAMPL